MKKVLILIVFIALPILSFGQKETVTSKEAKNTIIETVDTKETNTVEETPLSAAFKNQILDMSYKKSIELISIKAYRKSLQIKTKEIKTC